MPHVAELRYPGRWLDHEDHDRSLRVERRFHHLERFLAEAAVSLDLFEEAVRRRERGSWRLPEQYEHLAPHVHARGFMAAMEEIDGWLAVGECDDEPPGFAGLLVLEERHGDWYALRDAADGRAEVEVSAERLLAARDAIQAAIRALRWRGPCRLVP